MHLWVMVIWKVKGYTDGFLFLNRQLYLIFLSWFVLFCVIINFYLTRIHRIFSWFLAFLKFCSLYFYICEPFGVRLFFLHVKGLRFISFFYKYRCPTVLTLLKRFCFPLNDVDWNTSVECQLTLYVWNYLWLLWYMSVPQSSRW